MGKHHTTNTKVSVIIPIYNVEDYIERCIRALFEQTLEEIEYIFINDCTPDSSMSILEDVIFQYPNRREWIKIINLSKNKGAAYCREIGIKKATGEFIIHCDSDDWVDKNIYELMYKKAIEEKLDIVICDWYETNGRDHTPIYQRLNTKHKFLQNLINRSFSGSLWNKLVTRDLYQKIDRFPTAHMMEDVNYCIQLFANCKGKIGYIPAPLYYYYHNNTSICNNSSDESCIIRCQEAKKNIDDIIHFLEERQLHNKYKHELVVLKNSARVFVWPLYMREPGKYRDMWLNVYPEINNVYPFTKGINITLRIIFFLAWIGIYPYILRIIKKEYDT